MQLPCLYRARPPKRELSSHKRNGNQLGCGAGHASRQARTATTMSWAASYIGLLRPTKQKKCRAVVTNRESPPQKTTGPEAAASKRPTSAFGALVELECPEDGRQAHGPHRPQSIFLHAKLQRHLSRRRVRLRGEGEHRARPG